jgi:gamma-glutamyltranspeptidase / glutathione hydrolase
MKVKIKTTSFVSHLLVVRLVFLILLSSLPHGHMFFAYASTQTRAPVRSKRGMVASTKQISSEVGVAILKRGGNAVDAAIAVAFALAVTHPVAGNLGGGGFMLIRMKNGRTTAIDYRETAPRQATRDMYLDPNGALLKGEGSSTVGYRSGGVPGTVAGMDLALRKYGSGKLSWAQLIEPARELALDGFRIDGALAYSLRNSENLVLFSESKRIFLNNGSFLKDGDVLRQLELAETLSRLQRRGPREFYTGETARLIAADMKRHNGLVTLRDLRNYRPRERAPLRGTYRGNPIISMPPPSSGGVALVEMLNILEGFDVRRMGFDSTDYKHVLTEVMRRAFADRAEYLGDTDFVRVPIKQLIEKAYAYQLRSKIDMTRATKSADVRAGLTPANEPTETTHFTVVDKDGNAVANTYTLNGDYGSGATAIGTGILLNNEMDDFTSKSGTPNEYGLIQSKNNSIEPRKRPLSAMTPTFVLHRDGSLWFTLGSPGGPRIINAVLQALVNVIDFDMNLQQAIDAPRIHHQWMPDELFYEPDGLSAIAFDSLIQRGHRLTLRPEFKGYKRDGFMGDVEGIMIEQNTGARLGATDARRSDGPAVGY